VILAGSKSGIRMCGKQGCEFFKEISVGSIFFNTVKIGGKRSLVDFFSSKFTMLYIQ
jgi:hypothetical protein